MQYYWIDALSPLVFRSGKPFGAQSDTQDIIFPLPSSAAGLVRTLWAQQQHDFSGKFDTTKLKQIATHGIFLAQRDDSGSLKIFAPKPADALYLKNKDTDTVELIRLSPHALPENGGCDLPHKDLLPVCLPKDEHDKTLKGKPQSGKAFWLLSDWLDWANGKNLSFEDVDKNGVNLPNIDTRTHVAIDRDTLASQDGQLYQTAAYDFANARQPHHQGWKDTRLGFVLATPQNLQNDTVRFGGEGRLSRLENVNLAENPFRQPEISSQNRTIKLTLLTPAIFAQGWLPKWLDAKTLEGELPHTQIRVKLRAAALERWLPVSGWDLAEKCPKAMRKAVGAGSVYWLEILENFDEHYLKSLAYQSISDDEQDKKDGFGIVAVSKWKE